MKNIKINQNDLKQDYEALKLEYAAAKELYSKESEELKKALKALQENEEKYRRIVETAIEGILSLDSNARITFVNQQMASMLGYAAEEMVGELAVSFMAEDQLADHEAQMRSRKQGKNAIYERCFIKKDGSRLWALVSAKAVIAPDGNYIESFAMLTDITANKWAKDKLVEQNNFLELLINHMPNQIFWKDKNLAYRGCNKKFAEIVGVSDPKLIVGKTDYDLNRDKAYADRYREWDFQIMNSGEPVLNIEEKYYDSDGNEGDILTSKIPIKDSSNNVLGILGICVDITERKHAEDALRKNEKLLSAIIDFLPDATLAIDKDKRVIIWNRAIEEMTGIQAQDIVGKGDYAYTIPFYGTARPQLMDLFWDPEHFIAGQYPVLKKEGDILVMEALASALYNGKGAYIWAKASPLRDAEGNLVGAIECIRDITESKMAKESLSESEAKYRSIFENTGAASIISEEDTTISLANEEWENLSGLSKEESETKKSWTEFIAPEDVERMKKYHYDRRLKDGLAPRRYEFKFMRRNGEIRNMICTVAMIPGTKKSIASFMDITERTKAEEALALSEARFRALFDDNPSMYFIIDQQGIVQAVNKFGAYELGYEIEELLGQPISNIFYKADKEAVWEHLTETFQHPMEIRKKEFRKIRKDRSVLWVRETARAVLGADGNLLLLAVCEDITEQKEKDIELIKAKELAERNNKMKDGFIASISHEIRTPITGILGMTNIVHDSFLQYVTKDDEQYFISIEKSAKRLMNTVDMIIIFSRLQAGDFSIRPEEISVSSLIHFIMHLYKSKADEKSFRLFFYSDVEDDRIFADDSAVEMALENIIDNAVKYTESGSVVISMYRNEQNKLCVDIRDTGIGISEEYLPHIFEAYTQEVTGYNRPYEGLGLGLPIVKKLLELNNATINVNSKKGVGTLFSICFNSEIIQKEPLSKSGSDLNTMPVDVSKIQTDKKQKVMIVEDDEINQLLLKSNLKNSYDTIIAANAKEALEILDSQSLNLILMDISLKQGMNGLELTKFIRSGKENPNVPIIAVTGHAFPEDRRKAYEAGCNDFLVKPFKTSDLLEKIKNLLG